MSDRPVANQEALKAELQRLTILELIDLILELSQRYQDTLVQLNEARSNYVLPPIQGDLPPRMMNKEPCDD